MRNGAESTAEDSEPVDALQRQPSREQARQIHHSLSNPVLDVRKNVRT